MEEHLNSLLWKDGSTVLSLHRGTTVFVLLHLILLHAGVMFMGRLSTVPPVVWEVVCLPSETASPEADVPSEDTKEVSLSLPPSPSALAWQWLKAPELDTSSEILSSVDMFMGPCRGGQSDSYEPREEKTRSSQTLSHTSCCPDWYVEYYCFFFNPE